MATQLAYSAIEIVKAGVKDPAVFELVGLLEDNIGADRISDMVARIILPDLAAFSARVARNLGIITQRYTIASKPYDKQKQKPVILVPEDILHPLPIANDRGSVEDVIAYNAQLRRSMNQLIGRNWQATVRKMSKANLRSWLLNHPDLFQKFVATYKKHPPKQYDFKRDPYGVLSWHELAQKWAAEHPFQVEEKPIGAAEVEKVVLQICQHFGRLITREGLSLLLHDDQGHPRHEVIAKQLFYGMADAYCEANDLALTRQLNIDGEPIDFSVSRGYRAVVQVYVKLTTNSHLAEIYEKAMARCQEQEDGKTAVFVVIRLTEQDAQSPQLRQMYRQARQAGLAAPTLVLADGRFQVGKQMALLAQIRKEKKEQEQDTELPSNEQHSDGWERLSERRRPRAMKVKELKEANPGLSYLQVSMRAIEALGYEVTKDDVVNDYRRMKELGLIDWEWKRSNSIG
ncbi:MAG: hypothetical protein KDE56_02015 [Anaerolineales bacterium]|nr:hypothetical protein [Anaerolineales bacterium]